MSRFQFLLDEHVDPRLQKAVIRRAPQMVVWHIGDAGAPPLGTLDPDILIWCEEHGFSLVTNNRASIPVHLKEHLAAGRHIPGIFVLKPRMRIGQTADELLLIWGAAESEEYVDQINYLPITTPV